jgi:hypothetical protein
VREGHGAIGGPDWNNRGRHPERANATDEIAPTKRSMEGHG